MEDFSQFYLSCSTSSDCSVKVDKDNTKTVGTL